MNKALVTGSGTNITNITNFTNFRYKKRRCGNHWIVSGTVANELQVVRHQLQHTVLAVLAVLRY